MSYEQAKSDYMAITLPPEQLFLPKLPQYVKDDIELVTNGLGSGAQPEVLAAFHRLICELHITSDGNKKHLETADKYRDELNEIDTLLEECDHDLPNGNTVGGVRSMIKLVGQAKTLMENALDAICGKDQDL